MRKIAICDDQKEIAEYINTTCEIFYSTKGGVELTIFHQGEDIINTHKHFDIIFMDVELDNMSGIEAGLAIRKTDRNVIIIIISGNEQHKMNAYPLHVYDFLDKPLSQAQIIKTLTEVEEQCSNKKDRFFTTIKIRGNYIKIDVQDILYFEYIDRKIKVYTQTSSYVFNGNISNQAESMKCLGFGVSHAAYIVNFFHIKTIKCNEVILENGIVVPLSRYKAKDFKDAYSKYIVNQLAAKGR